MEKCAFDYEDGCKALNEKKCQGCHFFKTKEELEAGREKATDRLMTLDRALLNDIKANYYNGMGRKDGI